MGGLARWEILIPLLLLAVFFFGAKRLPEMGAAVGKTIREFQKSMREVTDHINPAPPAVPAPPATPELTAPAATPAAVPADAAATTAKAENTPTAS
ncbi:MAG TPA: twin-arginine translocase TatA/TatE family subunit [Ktedonobacterales bacterium]